MNDGLRKCWPWEAGPDFAVACPVGPQRQRPDSVLRLSWGVCVSALDPKLDPTGMYFLM